MSARPDPRLRRRIAIATAVGVVLLGSLLALPHLLGMRIVVGRGPSDRVRTAAALEQRWDEILEGVVHEGRVDYRALAARRDALGELVSTLAEFGPRTAPDAFADREARFAYYVNAYNLLVAWAVIDNDVRHSVHDVRGVLEPIEGMGFFWSQRFWVDGQLLSLYALENEVLRARFGDARLHAAINCASASCPALAEDAYRGATLDAQLADAAERFASRVPHVRVDDHARVVELSAIYDWYEEDFVAHAQALTAEPSVLAWIVLHADEITRADVERARDAGYELRFVPYDWRLNGRW